MQNTMTINEIMLAESKPSDIKKQDKETRKLIRMAKAKRFRLLNEEKRSKVGTPKTEKLFENIFKVHSRLLPLLRHREYLQQCYCMIFE